MLGFILYTQSVKSKNIWFILVFWFPATVCVRFSDSVTFNTKIDAKVVYIFFVQIYFLVSHPVCVFNSESFVRPKLIMASKLSKCNQLRVVTKIDCLLKYLKSIDCRSIEFFHSFSCIHGSFITVYKHKYFSNASINFMEYLINDLRQLEKILSHNFCSLKIQYVWSIWVHGKAMPRELSKFPNVLWIYSVGLKYNSTG